MFSVQLLSLVVLALILLQDLKERVVYWIWFPVLAGAFLFIRLHNTDDPYTWWKTITFNLILIGIQLLLLTVYFSWRQKRLTNITNGLLGCGDLLFLLSVTVYFSVANFMFFYIASLVVSLIIWLSIKGLRLAKTEKIPLAGFQALLLMLFLTAEWWPHWVNLGDDTWLLNLIRK